MYNVECLAKEGGLEYRVEFRQEETVALLWVSFFLSLVYRVMR